MNRSGAACRNELETAGTWNLNSWRKSTASSTIENHLRQQNFVGCEKMKGATVVGVSILIRASAFYVWPHAFRFTAFFPQFQS